MTEKLGGNFYPETSREGCSYTAETAESELVGYEAGYDTNNPEIAHFAKLTHETVQAWLVHKKRSSDNPYFAITYTPQGDSDTRIYYKGSNTSKVYGYSVLDPSTRHPGELPSEALPLNDANIVREFARHAPTFPHLEYLLDVTFKDFQENVWSPDAAHKYDPYQEGINGILLGAMQLFEPHRAGQAHHLVSRLRSQVAQYMERYRGPCSGIGRIQTATAIALEQVAHEAPWNRAGTSRAGSNRRKLMTDGWRMSAEAFCAVATLATESSDVSAGDALSRNFLLDYAAKTKKIVTDTSFARGLCSVLASEQLRPLLLGKLANSADGRNRFVTNHMFDTLEAYSNDENRRTISVDQLLNGRNAPHRALPIEDVLVCANTLKYKAEIARNGSISDAFSPFARISDAFFYLLYRTRSNEAAICRTQEAMDRIQATIVDIIFPHH